MKDSEFYKILKKYSDENEFIILDYTIIYNKNSHIFTKNNHYVIVCDKPDECITVFDMDFHHTTNYNTIQIISSEINRINRQRKINNLVNEHSM